MEAGVSQNSFWCQRTQVDCGARVVSTRSVSPTRACGEVQRPCLYTRCGLGQTALQERARPRAQQHEFAPRLHPTPHPATNGHPSPRSNQYHGRYPRAFLRPRTAALQERARPRAQQRELAPGLRPTSPPATNGHPSCGSNHYHGRYPRVLLRPGTAALRCWSRGKTISPQ
jgi:hypothetical protein